jgi:MOSC domain-containing protein YiiM
VSACPPRVLAISTGRVAPLYPPSPMAGDGCGPPPQGPVSAIRKSPASTLSEPRPVEVRADGVAGDEQADRTVHGGPDKAVSVYPVEHYAFWRDALRRAGVDMPLHCGALGENLTIEGLTEAGVWVGDRLEIGRVELLVAQPRQPCFKFDARMRLKGASRTMVRSGCTGFYCAVVRPGILSAGDEIRVHAGRRTVTIEQMHALTHRRQRDLFE